MEEALPRFICKWHNGFQMICYIMIGVEVTSVECVETANNGRNYPWWPTIKSMERSNVWILALTQREED